MRLCGVGQRGRRSFFAWGDSPRDSSHKAPIGSEAACHPGLFGLLRALQRGVCDLANLDVLKARNSDSSRA